MRNNDIGGGEDSNIEQIFKIISNIWVVNGWLNLTNMYNNKQQYLTNNYQLYNCTNTEKIMYLYRKNIASFYSKYLRFGNLGNISSELSSHFFYSV